MRAAAKQVHVEEGARTEDLELPQVPNTMVYELSDFCDAVDAVQAGSDPLDAPAGPFGNVRHYRDVTLASLALMDEARRQMGVSFPADALASDAPKAGER